MYEGGHDIGGTSGANVAAQRAFFNLLLLSAVGGAGGVPKAPVVSVTSPAADASFTSGDAVPVAGSATGGSGSNTYQWSSECFDSSATAVGGGTFDDGAAASTSFNAPPVPSLSTCNLTLTVIDSCGHVSYSTQTITVAPPPDTLDISIEKTAPSSVPLGSNFNYTRSRRPSTRARLRPAQVAARRTPSPSVAISRTSRTSRRSRSSSLSTSRRQPAL